MASTFGWYWPTEPRADVSGAALELLEILADAEAASRSGEDDRPHLGVARLLERRRREPRAWPR